VAVFERNIWIETNCNRKYFKNWWPRGNTRFNPKFPKIRIFENFKIWNSEKKL